MEETLEARRVAARVIRKIATRVRVMQFRRMIRRGRTRKEIAFETKLSLAAVNKFVQRHQIERRLVERDTREFLSRMKRVAKCPQIDLAGGKITI